MQSGFSGIFAIPWAQTQVDGVSAPPLASVITGATWSWSGHAMRMDGPQDRLVLQGSANVERLHTRASRRLQTVLNLPGPTDLAHDDLDNEPLLRRGFVLTDGLQTYPVSLIDTEHSVLLLLQNALPPQNCELWVVRQTIVPLEGPRGPRDVICFAQDTRIATPSGLQHVDRLAVGDLVLTKDNGPQPIRWIGTRRMSQARLMLMPALRPIRISAGSLPQGPDEDIRVSPAHRMLVQGRTARALFNTDEVLVPARDLLRAGAIFADHTPQDVIYHHLLFDRHEIIWAGGMETESFHPAHMPYTALRADDHMALSAIVPEPETYGRPARRILSASEAALMRHAA